MTTTADNYLKQGAFAYEQDDDWAKTPAGYEFPEAAGVEVDANDNVYVFNRGPHPVIVYDKNGDFVRSFGEDTFTARAHGIHISPAGECWLVDDSQHAIHKFDLQGKLLWTLGNVGQPADKWSGVPFNRPTHMCVSPNSGELYVTDGYGNSRVHRYSADGKLITSWGAVGTDPGEFCNPHNVIVDENENILVADRENNRVQVFDRAGAFLAEWGDFYHPMQIWVDDRDLVFVTDQIPRISLLSADGKLIGRCRGAINGAHGISGDAQGNLYLAELPPQEITKLELLDA